MNVGPGSGSGFKTGPIHNSDTTVRHGSPPGRKISIIQIIRGHQPQKEVFVFFSEDFADRMRCGSFTATFLQKPTYNQFRVDNKPVAALSDPGTCFTL